MANGGLITDYMTKAAGAPSAYAFPGGSTGVPSLGNNSTETGRYLNTTNNHEYAWDGAAWQDVTTAGSAGWAGTVVQNVLVGQITDNTGIHSAGGATYSTYPNLSGSITTTTGTRLAVTLSGKGTTAGGAGAALNNVAFRLLVDGTIVGYGLLPSGNNTSTIVISVNVATSAATHSVTITYNDAAPNTGSAACGLYVRCGGTAGEGMALSMTEMT